jgi:apolipoprotein N-acyltransferase
VRDGAEIIVLGTNDSWFLDSAAVYMHNAQAKLRAVETGRYIVRSANTGMSSIIDPNGVVLDEEPPLVGGYVIADVAVRDSATVYSVIGNLWVYALIAALLCLLSSIVIFERKKI